MKWIIVILLSSLPSVLSAETKPTETKEGRIVQLKNGEIVVDVGRAHGLDTGSRVQVYRHLVVTHPITGKVVQDRFLIGTIRLQQVGEQLSISTDVGKLSHPAKDGDFIIIEPPDALAKPKFEGSSDPEARAAEATFHETLGKPIPERIALWDEFLERFPDSKFNPVIAKERDWLQQRLSAERDLNEKVLQTETARRERELAKRSVEGSTSIPTEIYVGTPIHVVVAIERLDRLEQVRVLAKRKGDPHYEIFEMSKNGDSSFVADLPTSFSETPQDVSVFVEAVRVDGELERVGLMDANVAVVEKPSDPISESGRSRANVESEFVDFKSGEGDDQYWRVEGDFRYKLKIRGVDSFRVGAGIFRGTGNGVDEISSGESSTNLSLGYGFAETRFRVSPLFDTGITVLFGNRQGDEIQQFRSTLGLRTDLRLGAEDGTNLALGVSLTDGIGVESWLNLNLREIRRVPMRAQVVVTNLPVGRDLGVSLKYGAGYEIVDGLEVMAQIAWNARTIRHHGPGAGLSLNYKW